MASKPTSNQSAGALVPISVASDLSGVSLDEIEGWIADGSLVPERIGKRRRLYVDLNVVISLIPRQGGEG